MYDLAVAGDLTGFNFAMDALPEVSPAELDVLHAQSVEATLFIHLKTLIITPDAID